MPVMSQRYMGAFHGTRDMAHALYSTVPHRMEERLQSNAQVFDEEERKEEKDKEDEQQVEEDN